MHDDWIARKCQPNFWRNVCPNPRLQCGPYTPNNAFASQSSKIAWLKLFDQTAASFADTTLFCPSNSNNQYFGEGTNSRNVIDETNHDTLGMIVIDEAGDISVGTSSNGARNKIPGRVGDSPIVGSGAYVDNEVGGAAATGDGDIMLRFSPSFLAVEQMRLGFSPNAAAEIAISRIREKYPKFSGAVITANKRGEYGAACSGMEDFPFSIAQADFNNGTVFTRTVKCL